MSSLGTCLHCITVDKTEIFEKMCVCVCVCDEKRISVDMKLISDMVHDLDVPSYLHQLY